MFSVREPAADSTDEVAPSIEVVSAELRRAVAHIRRALRQRAQLVSLDGLTLTGSEQELLRQIRREPGLRVQDAATALGIAPNSVSTLVRKLTAARLLERSPDPCDGRVARLHITPRAHAFLARMRDEREAAITAALLKLPEEDRIVIAGVLPALGRLVDALSAPTDIPEPPTPTPSQEH